MVISTYRSYPLDDSVYTHSWEELVNKLKSYDESAKFGDPIHIELSIDAEKTFDTQYEYLVLNVTYQRQETKAEEKSRLAKAKVRREKAALAKKKALEKTKEKELATLEKLASKYKIKLASKRDATMRDPKSKEFVIDD